MKRLVINMIYMIALLQIKGGEALAVYYGDIGPPRHNEVHIAEAGIVMPLEKILLVRRDSDYCVIKFTKFWSENTSEVGSIFVAYRSDEYAMYELYYQGDKTGDFTKKNVQFKKEKLSFPKPRGIGRLAFSFGNKDIQCGSINLFWAGGGSVYFYSSSQKQGDYGIELAPTKWTDISQVNVFDSRIKWYRYDENRPRINIPLDKL